MRSTLSFLSLFLILFLTSSIAEEVTEVRVLSVGFYEVDQAVKLAEKMLSPEGKVFGDERTLQIIVEDYPKNLDRIEAYFKGQKPPRNIRIEVVFTGERFLDRSTRLDDVTYSGGEETQMLTVYDGGTGYLHIGEKIPEPHYFFSSAKRWGILEVIYDYRDVGSRLVVRPRIRGKLIDIYLIPEISYVVGGKPHSIAFTGLETRVTVSDGQSIEIGGLDDAVFGDHFFRARTGGTLRIILTPHIL